MAAGASPRRTDEASCTRNGAPASAKPPSSRTGLGTPTAGSARACTPPTKKARRRCLTLASTQPPCWRRRRGARALRAKGVFRPYSKHLLLQGPEPPLDLPSTRRGCGAAQQDTTPQPAATPTSTDHVYPPLITIARAVSHGLCFCTGTPVHASRAPTAGRRGQAARGPQQRCSRAPSGSSGPAPRRRA